MAKNADSKSMGLKPKHIPYGVLVVFFLLIIGIITAGYLYYDKQKANYTEHEKNDLAAVSALKVGQIANWREERLTDARLIFHDKMIARKMGDFFAGPRKSETGKELVAWMSLLTMNKEYSEVFLLDSKGKTALSVHSGSGEAEPHSKELAVLSVKSREIILTDFHRSDASNKILLGLVIPIYFPEDRPVGSLLITIDPHYFLYPHIQTWPAPSRTAETLLVRREGNDVLYLNELRHRKNTALSLRIPHSDKALPAAMALLGRRGLVEGSDYRGIPVVASVDAVPGSPWFIVAKIDKDEIYEHVREEFLITTIVVIVLIFSSGLGIVIWWRQQSVLFYRKQYEAELQHKAEIEESKAALREQRDKAQKYLDVAGVMMVALDKDGTVSLINKKGCDILGYDEKDITGKNWFDNFLPPQIRSKVKEVFRMLMAGETEPVEYFENPVLTKNGEERTMAWRNVILKDASGSIVGTLSSGGDITERKRAELKLFQYMEDLKRSNEELQRFAYIASHDLQEPLRMIASYLQLIERRYKGRLDRDADEFIAFAVEGAARLQDMIAGLLAFSRVGTKGKPLEEVNSAKALGNAVIDLKFAIEESGALVTSDSLPIVRADKSQLIQVFQNLISNAIKFKGERPPLIHVSAERKGAEWVFSVRDNCVGIAPEYKGKVFNIFQRFHGREYPGVGIGLSLCRRVVERHGGRIWFESEIGKGTTFYFTIPDKEGA